MLDGIEISACIQECKNQRATQPEDYVGMALAFAHAKAWAEHPNRHVDRLELEWLIFRLIEMILGEATDYRTVQVTINSVKAGADPQDIEWATLRYCQHFADLNFATATDAYREFELIHPFRDGNGRVGMCLYNVYHCLLTGQWKGTQAPNVFDATPIANLRNPMRERIEKEWNK